MSDSIPISLYLLSPHQARECFGDEVGSFLDTTAPGMRLTVRGPLSFCKPQRRWDRFIEVFSRNGAFVRVFAHLVENSGFANLQFLGDQRHTHEVVIQSESGSPEVRRFTVIRDGHGELADETEAFISWCRVNSDAIENMFSDMGNGLNGHEFSGMVDVIDQVQYSLCPSDDYGHADSDQEWSASVGFCLIRTLVYLLRLAQRSGHLVICEQWAGIESPVKPNFTMSPAFEAGELLTPSPQLAAVVGEQRLRMTEIVSRFWTYVKANGLQDSVTRRMINADALLLPIFGKAQISMFELPVILRKHVC